MLELLRSDKIESFVMDAEIVAVDKDTGAYRTFQDLSNRAKKDVKMEDVKVIVGVFAFDLMLINDVVSGIVSGLNFTLPADVSRRFLIATAPRIIFHPTSPPPYPLSAVSGYL